MKYATLTREQFEALHPEFINFLATQSIDKAEWDRIKAEKPEVAAQELDVFSDLIWEGVLSRAQYLEHYSTTHVFLFACSDVAMRSIVIKAVAPGVNLLADGGIAWLSENLFTDATEIRTGTKPFGPDRNADIFTLIQQGAVLADGVFFEKVNAVIQG